MTGFSLVAAALEVQGTICAYGAAELCPWPGSCCECLSQPSPRPLAVLLGFYLPSRSPGWALAVSGWCRKAALCSSRGLALRCLSPLVWPCPWLGPGAQSRATELNAFQLKKCSGLQYSVLRGWGSSACFLFLALQAAIKPGHCQRMSREQLCLRKLKLPPPFL